VVGRGLLRIGGELVGRVRVLRQRLGQLDDREHQPEDEDVYPNHREQDPGPGRPTAPLGPPDEWQHGMVSTSDRTMGATKPVSMAHPSTDADCSSRAVRLRRYGATDAVCLARAG
jgi:hypothetical protein